MHGVRAEGAPIRKSGGTSSGIKRILKNLNEMQLYIDQGGNRPGAFAIYLGVDHDDIFTFLRLARLKGDLVDRSQAIAHVFRLARTERDAWLNWPARISAQMAAKLEVDAHALHVALEASVREHLMELGDLHLRVN